MRNTNTAKRASKFIANTALVFAVVMGSVAVAGSYGKKMDRNDIVDTAVSAGQFATLAAALAAADLVGTLKGDGPFTVFAPTDAAFAKLPEGHSGVASVARKPRQADRDSDLPRCSRESLCKGRRETQQSHYR